MEEIYLDFDETLHPRLLQDDSSNTTTTTTLTDTEIIWTSLVTYGSIFAALFLVFLIARPRYPRVYNLKKSFPALHAPIADNAFGSLSWIWKVFSIDYEDISEQCGMDAVTTIKILEMGVKLSLVGVFNSAFLAPVYALLGNVVGQSDPVKGVSLSNLEPGHSAAIATTVAAYIFFGCFMHWIDKDFEWFTSHRHEFLSKKRETNYSLFLSGLPPEMQSNKVIEEYFGNCFSHDAVADVHVALVIPNLEKKVAKRDALVPKLEHAINVLTIKNKTPTHKTKICGGEKVESVPTYTKDIEDFNEDISRDIDNIEVMQNERDGAGRKTTTTEEDVEAGKGEMTLLIAETASEVQVLPDEFNDDEDPNQKDKESKIDEYRLTQTFKSGATVLKSMIIGEDGAPRNAVFVSFATLTDANLARQAVHNQEPWCCVPKEPPRPDLVNWKNIGRSNFSKQIGELTSMVLTVALCIFWTIPVSFVASLSNVEALTELLPFLKEPVENYAWLAGLLALLAPLLLVVFISLLPYIILFIIKFEGLVEIETMQHPSLFAKLAAFTIVQTFFISTIASTLFSKLGDILKNPTSAITLFAEALPAQSAYFIQIIMVQNFLSLGIELVRISPIAQNFARKIVSNLFGHNLTEKERNETFLGLRSLDDPLEYYFGRELGTKIVLLQMVLFVYGCMAPITSYFTLLIYGLLVIGYRHQFIYIYPISGGNDSGGKPYPIGNDSGGKLWINFQRLTIACAIVSEIVLCAVLLLKETFIAAVLMIPLIVITILFDLYFKRRHYSITSYLPLGDCAAVDRENESEGMTHEWLNDAYLQPALKERVAFPKKCPEIVSMAGQREEPTSWEDETAVADDHKENGNSSMSNKEYKLALQQYNQAIAVSPSGPNTYIYYSNRAAAFCYLGEYDAAVDDCRKSIQLNPTYEKAHTRLGLSLFFQRDYEGAIDAYEQSLDLDPTNEACFNYMVKAKERLGAQRLEEPIDAESSTVCGSSCWGPLGKSQSFDPSITNED
mmetsp:Transcript_29069/g.50173  ORF Transcript_29069/g.50173 Transcript_29069/m.50173 type:complete len:1011 (-) Transcript_29069:114-3146(-)